MPTFDLNYIMICNAGKGSISNTHWEVIKWCLYEPVAKRNCEDIRHSLNEV